MLFLPTHRLWLLFQNNALLLLILVAILIVLAVYWLLNNSNRTKKAKQQKRNNALLASLLSNRFVSALKNDKVSSQTDAREMFNIYQLSYPPGPFCFPIIGNLHLLAPYSTNPWYGFDQLRARYGDVVWLQLGTFSAVLISSLESMREVLLTKGEHFANRPHFNRHDVYFSMNRQNALALCDWTEVHKQRRSIAHAAVIPRFGTKCFQRLSSCVSEELEKLFCDIEQNQPEQTSEGVDIEKADFIMGKNSITELCCKIFFNFLLDCNLDKNNDDKKLLKELAEKFDFIFYDINQMNISDFVPLLQHIGLVRNYFHHLFVNSNWVFEQVESIVVKRFKEIRFRKEEERRHSVTDDCLHKSENILDNKCIEGKQFCDERFVDEILLNKQYKSSARFLDFILEHYLENEKIMTWNEMLYEIGDLIGGNSAVANLLFRLLGHLAVNPKAQQLIFEQVKAVAARKALAPVQIAIEDQSQMPLVNAAIMETLRLAASPIVPHLSRWDTSIQGHFIPKGTMVLFNIYHLNLSTGLYSNPFEFDPTRFITEQGNLVKPDYFFPFSHGRRSCLGYKMVNLILSSTVANLLLQYHLVPLSTENRQNIEQSLQPKGTLALPFLAEKCYKIGLKNRN